MQSPSGVPSENSAENDDDIRKLADDFNIPLEALQDALSCSRHILMKLREASTPPVSKAKIDGLRKHVERSIAVLSLPGVQERLLAGEFDRVFKDQVSEDDADGVQQYAAWCEARGRIERMTRSLNEFGRLLNAQEGFRSKPGRPHYDDWRDAMVFLRNLWIRDLRRNEEISPHWNAVTYAKPTELVAFVHRAMQLVGESISEQQCRHVLSRLRQDGGRLSFEPEDGRSTLF